MPYPGEHACRLRDPKDFDKFARQNCQQKHDGKCIDVIFGIKDNKSEIQALRYDKSIWTADAARSHCGSRGGAFEAASGKEMEVKRLYSVMEIKSVDEEQRVIEGIATTPTPDRVDDVVVQEGIEYVVPIPFLYQHNSRQPIGMVIDARMEPKGMWIKVKIAAAGVATFIDEAWALIKAKLVRGLSIGFRSLEESYDKERHAFNYLRIELLEISAVTIPANAEATILSVKSASSDALAAFGRNPSEVVTVSKNIKLPGAAGVTGVHTKKGNMTIAELIASLEAKRAATLAAKEAIRKKATDEGRTMDEREGQEYDGLQTQIDTIDTDLKRYRKDEEQLVASATPITAKAVTSPQAGANLRGGVVTVKGPKLLPGTAFVRFAMALMAAKGDEHRALQMVRGNKSWMEQTPELETVLKAAVAAGTTTATGWAAELADYTYMASEFIEFLRPQTIIGKIPNLRKVPFNIKVARQTSATSAGWVGEGGRKPLTKLGLDTIEFRFFKAAGIVVLTEELVRLSNPSAEALVRQDLADTIIQFLDEQFIDPTVAGSANVSPASVLNGSSHAAASGTSADDFRADFKTGASVLIAADIPMTGLCFVLQPSLALSMSLMRNALGQKEFPDVKAEGGSLEGYLAVTSNSACSGVVGILAPSEILLADEGGITLDASREASLVMDDGGSPAVVTMHSLWQENKVGLRVERTVNWAKRRTAATYYITSANYAAGSP